MYDARAASFRVAFAASAGDRMTGAVATPGAAPSVPVYGPGSLGAVLPGVAASLGVRLAGDLPAVPLPRAERVCLVLVDGMGALLLAEAAARGDAPFLAELMAGGSVAGLPATLRAGVPSTTATSMGSLGTGLPPGRHGIVGFKVRDPERGSLVNQLRWDPYTDPIGWQPHATMFSQIAAAGVAVANIGAAEFDGSGLTTAAHRGAVFTGFEKLAARVDATLASLAEPGRRLTYLYWGAVDKIGHEKGCRSPEWAKALRECDAELARLAAALPAGTLLIVTADHGMVDVPHETRLDMATVPELRRGIGLYGGEPRMVQVYCRNPADYAVAEVRGRLADAVGERAWVRTRAEAIAEGWFGPVVDPRVAPRIGDILVAARGDFALIDSGLMDKKGLALIGHHGSLTDAEQLVPLLVRVV